MCIVVVHTKRKSNNFFQWNNFIYTSASRKHYTFYHHLHYWYKVIYYFVLGILRTAIHPKVFTTNIGELRLWIKKFYHLFQEYFVWFFSDFPREWDFIIHTVFEKVFIIHLLVISDRWCFKHVKIISCVIIVRIVLNFFLNPINS